MSKRNEEKDADRKPAKTAARKKPAGLSDDLRDLTNDKARIAADFMLGRAENMQSAGRGRMAKIGRRVRSKPGQSIGIAFVAGVVASFLLSRR